MDEITDKENPENPKSEPTTPNGFGKGVNDYLNHHITVADAKAGALLVANFVLLGGLINLKICCSNLVLFILTGAVSIFSIIFCCVVIYPRLTKSEKGLIFWENIKSYASLDEYLIETAKLNHKLLEEEYAKQNWHISKVLSTKNKNVRVAVLTFCFSLTLIVITYLITSF